MSIDLAKRLAYHLAVADAMRAARDFLNASLRFAEAARQLDPDASLPDDEGILLLVNGIRDLLALAARSSPGVRLLMQEALAMASTNDSVTRPTSGQPAGTRAGAE